MEEPLKTDKRFKRSFKERIGYLVCFMIILVPLYESIIVLVNVVEIKSNEKQAEGKLIKFNCSGGVRSATCKPEFLFAYNGTEYRNNFETGWFTESFLDHKVKDIILISFSERDPDASMPAEVVNTELFTSVLWFFALAAVALLFLYFVIKLK